MHLVSSVCPGCPSGCYNLDIPDAGDEGEAVWGCSQLWRGRAEAGLINRTHLATLVTATTATGPRAPTLTEETEEVAFNQWTKNVCR